MAKKLIALIAIAASLTAAAAYGFVFTIGDKDEANDSLSKLVAGNSASRAPSQSQLTAVAAVAASLSGTVYVDCSASANGSGSSSSPYNNLASLNTQVLPGTSILFKRGARCVGQFVTQGSGTASSPITVGAYGTGTARPIIDGNGVNGTLEAGAAFYLLNQEYWRVSDIEVTNDAATAAVRNGILVILRGFQNGTGSDGKPQGIGRSIYLNNVYVHDVAGGAGISKSSNGIQFTVTGTTVANWFDDIKVTNSHIANVEREGLTTGSSQSCRQYALCAPNPASSTDRNQWRPFTRVLFQNNLIENIGGDGIVLRNSIGAKVWNNTGRNLALKAWEAGQAASAGFWVINSNDAEFAWNEVYGTKKVSGNVDGMAFDADIAVFGATFKWNYSHDNEGGFMLFCGCGSGYRTTNITVRDNISINDGLKGRLIFAAGIGYKNSRGAFVEGATVSNNSFYIPSTNTVEVIDWEPYVGTINFRNNIVYSKGSLVPGATQTNSNPIWANNIFFGMSSAAAPSGGGSLLVDPKFVGPLPATAPVGYASTANTSLFNAFKILSSSPAIKAGVVTGVGGGDFFGANAHPSACKPDIGAHQLTPTASACN